MCYFTLAKISKNLFWRILTSNSISTKFFFFGIYNVFYCVPQHWNAKNIFFFAFWASRFFIIKQHFDTTKFFMETSVTNDNTNFLLVSYTFLGTTTVADCFRNIWVIKIKKWKNHFCRMHWKTFFFYFMSYLSGYCWADKAEKKR